MIVFPEPARIGVDDMLQFRQAVLHGKDLIDLFLVLHHSEADARVLQHVLHLLGDAVLINWHRDRAAHLRGGHGPIEARAVGSDDGDPVAFAEAKALEAQREGADLIAAFGPAVGLPDAVKLFAHRRRGAAMLRIPVQQLWQRIKRLRRRDSVAHERFLPLPRGRCPDPMSLLRRLKAFLRFVGRGVKRVPDEFQART